MKQGLSFLFLSSLLELKVERQIYLHACIFIIILRDVSVF